MSEPKKKAVAEAVEEAITIIPENVPDIKVVAVVPALLQEVLNILQTELPMKTVRNIVLQLEQCPIMTVDQKPKVLIQ